MGKVILMPNIKPKELEVQGIKSDVKIKCPSSSANLFDAYKLSSEADLNLIHPATADAMLVDADGSRSENCDIIKKLYEIDSFWTGEFFAHEKPGKKIGDVITRDYSDVGHNIISKFILPKEIRGEIAPGEVVAFLTWGLTPGVDFSVDMKGNTITIECKPEHLLHHSLPVDEGYYPLNEETFIPSAEGTGQERYLYRYNDNSAVAAVVRWLYFSYSNIFLLVSPDYRRGVLVEEK